MPLTSHVRRLYRALHRLALRGPVWTPLAMAAAAFMVGIMLPLLWGGGVAVDGPWRWVALALAAGMLAVGVSAWPARVRLHREEMRRRELEELRRMPREQVAALVADAYRRAGYRVVETGRGVGAGIDMDLLGRRGTTLVQCRHHRQPVVDIGNLRELQMTMRSAGARRGVVVTTGGHTELAGSFARVHDITIVDGRTLLRMARVARPAPVRGRLASD
jgi:restriction system protein